MTNKTKNTLVQNQCKYSIKMFQFSFAKLNEDFLGYAIANEILHEFPIYLIGI